VRVWEASFVKLILVLVLFFGSSFGFLCLGFVCGLVSRSVTGFSFLPSCRLCAVNLDSFFLRLDCNSSRPGWKFVSMCTLRIDIFHTEISLLLLRCVYCSFLFSLDFFFPPFLFAFFAFLLSTGSLPFALF